MNKSTTPRSQMTGAVRRGGLDINPDDYPDSVYWRRSAERAKRGIYELCPPTYELHIATVLAQVWNDRYTWRDIFIQTQGTLDLLHSHSAMLEHQPDWMTDAQAQAADAADLLATQEAARF